MILWLRSALFFAGMVVSVLAFWPVCMLSWLLPIIPRMRIIGLWARFINLWLQLTCSLRYQVHGLENLPAQPCVILSKHQSAWETIVFQVIFPLRPGRLNGKPCGFRCSAGVWPQPTPLPSIARPG
ncbi:MAG: hypothetical protein Ct9H300mP16_01240 [Pseudomonadota bacterium]|nr:MAG: hypothetical protein Ct9H300mP16_01240 [Pseudomonadota bacterium]